jgi:hypothetical protein
MSYWISLLLLASACGLAGYQLGRMQVPPPPPPTTGMVCITQSVIEQCLRANGATLPNDKRGQ